MQTIRGRGWKSIDTYTLWVKDFDYKLLVGAYCQTSERSLNIAESCEGKSPTCGRQLVHELFSETDMMNVYKSIAAIPQLRENFGITNDTQITAKTLESNEELVELFLLALSGL